VAFRWPELRTTAVLLSNVSDGERDVWPLLAAAVERMAEGAPAQ
jgi:hypothetical protein